MAGYIDVERQEELPQNLLEEIEKNPKNLTKEGCIKEIELWRMSVNRVQQKKYEEMLKRCKKWAKSGKVKKTVWENGKEVEKEVWVFSRDENGNPKWTGEFDNPKILEEFKQYL